MKADTHTKNVILWDFLIAAALAAVYFLGLAGLLKIPVQDLPQILVNSFYSPKHNLIFVNDINGINANLILLFLTVFTALGLKISRRIFRKPARHPAVMVSVLTALILCAGIQVINYARYGIHQNKILYRKTEKEKKEAVFGDLYAFSKFCRKHISQKAHGRLITDIDLQSTTGAYMHNALAYNLFPLTIQYNPRQLHIVPNYTVPKNPPDRADYLIIYKKKSPAQFVPADFEILEYYDENSLIAVRKS